MIRVQQHLAGRNKYFVVSFVSLQYNIAYSNHNLAKLYNTILKIATYYAKR